MTERIDHAAEAQSILRDIDTAGPNDNLPMDWCGADADEQWLVHASLREAQVHATLALVEQQRIANLIAYVALLEQQFAEAAQHPTEFDWETREDSEKRHTEALVLIREGLNL
ncbi:hypothetical protein [Microbacterium jejuense]|uniref:hypothetical protein n=1 Tax=Microbacterium jejuense TaxID=1263637 RepID=UPI0031F0B317